MTILEAPQKPVFERTIIATVQEFYDAAQSTTTMGWISAQQIGIVEARQGGFSPSSTTPRFTALRVKQIMVWGPEDGKGYLTLETRGSLNNLTLQDDAMYRSFGIPGSRRAALNIRPNFLQRNQWLDSQTSAEATARIFTVAVGGTTTESALENCVVRLTLALR
jgi:hypothetical protein